MGKYHFSTKHACYGKELDEFREAGRRNFFKIITGVLDVENGFEQFVNDWYALGGTQITQEIKEQLQ